MMKRIREALRRTPVPRVDAAELDRCRKELDLRLAELKGMRAERDLFKSDAETFQELAERLENERDQLKAEADRYRTWAPPGHFSSPIPSVNEVRTHEEEIYRITRDIPGVNLRELEQLKLFDELIAYYAEQPFAAHKSDGLRYWFENPAYSYSDAILLYCMMRRLRPKRVIEIGSGYSSCAILDVNELFFDNSIACTFIDPDPTLLHSLIRDEDRERAQIVTRTVQEIDLDIFKELTAGDILFIDSSHVSKVHSDINHIFFKVLPVLNAGVFVHFHDIFYPFEYPLDWVYEGRAWNEAYLARAFLQYNSEFEIQLFNTFIDWFHKKKYFREMPLVQKNTGGSLWIKRVVG